MNNDEKDTKRTIMIIISTTVTSILMIMIMMGIDPLLCTNKKKKNAETSSNPKNNRNSNEDESHNSSSSLLLGNDDDNGVVYDANARRIQHGCSGIVLYVLSFVLDITTQGVPLLIMGIILLYQLPKRHPKLFHANFGTLVRSSNNRHPCEGAIYFLLGTLLTAIWFPIPYSRMALICLSFGDPMSSYFILTTTNSQQHMFVKSWQSALSCWIICYILVMGITFFSTTTNINSSIMATVAATACTVTEIILAPILNINDNLLIPIVTAASLTFIFPTPTPP